LPERHEILPHVDERENADDLALVVDLADHELALHDALADELAVDFRNSALPMRGESANASTA